jgi:hypothetical protein
MMNGIKGSGPRVRRELAGDGRFPTCCSGRVGVEGWVGVAKESDVEGEGGCWTEEVGGGG